VVASGGWWRRPECQHYCGGASSGIDDLAATLPHCCYFMADLAALSLFYASILSKKKDQLAAVFYGARIIF